jgi:hypothetical protein
MNDQAGLVQRVMAYRAAKASHEQATAKVANVQADLARQDALVELLGPKGILATALQAALGDFLAAVNGALAAFGFSLDIQVEPWQVLVRKGDAAPVRFALLSAGEQLWTALAFQLALAIVSGLKLVVVDAAEAVVGQHRAILTELVMAAPDVQVIVAMARGANEPAPDIPGLQVLRLA